MKKIDFLKLAMFGLKTIIFNKRDPILGTIILTDYCNLNCKHCAVNNINRVMYPYDNIVRDMQSLYNDGIRILFFCGGETTLWEDEDKNIRDLIKQAKDMGFYIVNIVTNGTIDLDIPEADVIFLSIDGDKEVHNLVRGDTFGTIMNNLSKAKNSNICVYMAINKLNYTTVNKVIKLVNENSNINSISFNFHTPYKGTEQLSLTNDEKRQTIESIKDMMKKGMPIFNLQCGLDRYLQNNWKRPCYQCIVSENGKRYVCGRCVEEKGLCEQCGYLFAIEFSMIFSGNIKAIFQMCKIYLKYV